MHSKAVSRTAKQTGRNNKLDMRLFDFLKNGGIFPGSIVLSKAGHDIDRMYLVISVKNKIALLIDGMMRTKDHPKKKRITHLKQIGTLQDWEDKWRQLDLAEEESEENRLTQEWLSDVLTKNEKNEISEKTVMVK